MRSADSVGSLLRGGDGKRGDGVSSSRATAAAAAEAPELGGKGEEGEYEKLPVGIVVEAAGLLGLYTREPGLGHVVDQLFGVSQHGATGAGAQRRAARGAPSAETRHGRRGRTPSSPTTPKWRPPRTCGTVGCGFKRRPSPSGRRSGSCGRGTVTHDAEKAFHEFHAPEPAPRPKPLGCGALDLQPHVTKNCLGRDCRRRRSVLPMVPLPLRSSGRTSSSPHASGVTALRLSWPNAIRQSIFNPEKARPCVSGRWLLWWCHRWRVASRARVGRWRPAASCTAEEARNVQPPGRRSHGWHGRWGHQPRRG